MSDIRGCNIPDGLLYWPEKHVWCRMEADGVVTIGVTDVAQHLAGAVISALPKAGGKAVKRGRSLGTMESGKWVGPVTAPISGVVTVSNPMLGTDPGIINRDPYGEGWYVKMDPEDWDTESGELVTGEAGIAAYRAFLDAEGITCGG